MTHSNPALLQTDNKEVEIICIGTELLLGNILNSNARWIAEELSSLGLSHFRQTVIGDNLTRLKLEIIKASKRSQILITTGGLGPTEDDLTTEAIAAAFNTPLEEHKALLIDIQNKFKATGKIASKNNYKQALLPKGAKILPNPTGTAAGMIWSPKPNFTIITFPGVPSELKTMWQESAKDWLRNNGGNERILLSKTLKFTGIPESFLVEKIADLLTNQNPTLAPYASFGEVKLRITAAAKNITEAKKIIKPMEVDLLNRLRDNFFGSDNDTLASIVIDILRKRGETLAIAESCTGGGLGAALTSVPGASDVFLGGVIAYSNSMKKKLLNVSDDLLEKHGAVSKAVIESMAKQTLKTLGSDWAIAISGIAGPNGGTPKKPVGFVQICIAGPNHIKSSPQSFSSHRGREVIQQLSVVRSLDLLRLALIMQS